MTLKIKRTALVHSFYKGDPFTGKVGGGVRNHIDNLERAVTLMASALEDVAFCHFEECATCKVEGRCNERNVLDEVKKLLGE